MSRRRMCPDCGSRDRITSYVRDGKGRVIGTMTACRDCGKILARDMNKN